ncbi:rCG63703 [Rattus norvegicus]|uniref:RCG63703 n=1 Tax=Rattus norvegicus TaxID=10116 RepID=A6IGE1_RAT|nr:rCG63703 [Rattus norvegicus]
MAPVLIWLHLYLPLTLTSIRTAMGRARNHIKSSTAFAATFVTARVAQENDFFSAMDSEACFQLMGFPWRLTVTLNHTATSSQPPLCPCHGLYRDLCGGTRHLVFRKCEH